MGDCTSPGSTSLDIPDSVPQMFLRTGYALIIDACFIALSLGSPTDTSLCRGVHRFVHRIMYTSMHHGSWFLVSRAYAIGEWMTKLIMEICLFPEVAGLPGRMAAALVAYATHPFSVPATAFEN